jgi:hypothetical protein
LLIQEQNSLSGERPSSYRDACRFEPPSRSIRSSLFHRFNREPAVQSRCRSRFGGSLLFIKCGGAIHRGLRCHCPWSSDSSPCLATEASQFSRGEHRAIPAPAIRSGFSSKPEVHCHTMAIKTVVLPRPSDTREPAPIVVEDSRWIIQVGKDRYAVDFHATARQVKQEPAKVVPIQSKLGSL